MIALKNNTRLYVLLLLILSGFFLNSGCKKENTQEKPLEVSSVTDIEGHTYKTVKIGSQWWMAENLRVKTYNDGSPIAIVGFGGADSIWAKKQSGAFCNIDSIYDNRGYGLHYNWYVINDVKKIAPEGWHIPNDDEWKTLEKELGMSQTEADKTGWRGTEESKKLIPIPPNNGWPTASIIYLSGTNESGFTALPGGCRLFDGSIGEVQFTGYWWSSDMKDATDAYYRAIASSHLSIFRYYADKRYGMCIRCVKD